VRFRRQKRVVHSARDGKMGAEHTINLSRDGDDKFETRNPKFESNSKFK
jgi:hypothetical protein